MMYKSITNLLSGSRGGSRGAPPLIFAETGARPPIFAETGRLTVCGHPGATAFLLKKRLRTLLKIPGSTPGKTSSNFLCEASNLCTKCIFNCNLDLVWQNICTIHIWHTCQQSQKVGNWDKSPVYKLQSKFKNTSKKKNHLYILLYYSCIC